MATENPKPAAVKKREAFRQACLQAWSHYLATGKHLSFAEADAWLAKLEAGQDVELPECPS